MNVSNETHHSSWIHLGYCYYCTQFIIFWLNYVLCYFIAISLVCMNPVMNEQILKVLNHFAYPVIIYHTYEATCLRIIQENCGQPE